MNQKLLMTSTGLILGIVLFFAINMISNGLFKSARIDLTDNGLYTLSQGSKNIVANLVEPVSLRFYLSEKLVAQLGGLSSYTVRVRELLEEYSRASNGKLDLHIIEPEPFSEAEDKAVSYGLKGVPIDTNNTTFYFGLVGTNSTDGEEIIDFFNPSREEFLEYDITQLIYKLDNPKQKVVGLMSTLPIQGDAPAGAMPFMQQGGAEPWMIVEQIQQLFEVRTLETTITDIPDDVEVLMLVHPKGLSDATLYAIDQFVLNGGRLLAFVDPYAETDEPPRDPKNPLASMNAPRNSDLSKLMDAWGVELESNKVVGDLTVSKQVQMQKGSRSVVVNYPVWIDLSEENFNAEDIITGKLDTIALATAGSLKSKEGAETTLSPLLSSSDQAMLIDTQKLGMFSNPEEMVRDFRPEQSYVVAGRVSGKVKTAFPDGKPKAEDDDAATDTTEGLKESKEDINVILIADTDLLEDKFWVRVQNFLGNRIALPQAANDKLITNALDNLTGSNDLISVRNRGTFTRPFTKVDSIRQAAEMKFREKEKQLLDRLKNTEQKLRDFQNQKPGSNALILNAEQQKEITRFREEKVKIRKELRGVQHELQKDIERLEARVKFINIALIPLLVGIAGVGLGYYRNRRRKLLAAA